MSMKQWVAVVVVVACLAIAGFILYNSWPMTGH
jgi:hypothetical protein